MAERRLRENSIDDEIEKKIYSIDIVRTARIKASERLYKYSDAWDFLFLGMNIVSVALLIVSLLPLPINNSKSGLMISASFSLYTMLVQYFCSAQNYNERALKYHYHQLELENFVLQLKNIFLKHNTGEGEYSELDRFRRYRAIMEKYQISLQGYENHEDVDYKIAKRQLTRNSQVSENEQNTNCFQKFLIWKETKDFSPDNIFIYLQIPIVIIIILLYSWVAYKGLK
ncbi:TPA: SLATT domain-containing protein [Streptococcus suis]